MANLVQAIVPMKEKQRKRIFWLGAHKLLIRTELVQLRAMGYEVFCPPYLSHVPDQSASTGWDPNQQTSLPDEIFRELSSFNFFYNTPTPKIAQILNQYFDAVIVTIVAKWAASILRCYSGPCIFRAYGQTHVLSDQLEQVGMRDLIVNHPAFYFCPHSAHVLEQEADWLTQKATIIPYSIDSDVFKRKDIWLRNTEKSGNIIITAPNIMGNIFHKAHYDFLKEFFYQKHFKYAGVQLQKIDDPQVVGSLPIQDLHNFFADSSGYLYTYRDPRVCYLPPIEMIIYGGPVSYFKDSLLSKYVGKNAPGEAKSIEEAHLITSRFRTHDVNFIDEVRDSQRHVADLYNPEIVQPIFEEKINQLLGSLNSTRKMESENLEHNSLPAPQFQYNSMISKKKTNSAMLRELYSKKMINKFLKNKYVKNFIEIDSKKYQNHSENWIKILCLGCNNSASKNEANKLKEYGLNIHIEEFAPVLPLTKNLDYNIEYFSEFDIVIVWDDTLLFCEIVKSLPIPIIFRSIRNEERLHSVLWEHYSLHIARCRNDIRFSFNFPRSYVIQEPWIRSKGIHAPYVIDEQIPTEKIIVSGKSTCIVCIKEKSQKNKIMSMISETIQSVRIDYIDEYEINSNIFNETARNMMNVFFHPYTNDYYPYESDSNIPLSIIRGIANDVPVVYFDNSSISDFLGKDAPGAVKSFKEAEALIKRLQEGDKQLRSDIVRSQKPLINIFNNESQKINFINQMKNLINDAHSAVNPLSAEQFFPLNTSYLASKIKKSLHYISYKKGIFISENERRSASVIIDTIYKVLLKRGADPSGINSYSRNILEKKDVSTLVNSILNSQEYKTKLDHDEKMKTQNFVMALMSKIQKENF